MPRGSFDACQEAMMYLRNQLNVRWTAGDTGRPSTRPANGAGPLPGSERRTRMRRNAQRLTRKRLNRGVVRDTNLTRPGTTPIKVPDREVLIPEPPVRKGWADPHFRCRVNL